MNRKEIYRRFLRAKGRYAFFYATNLTTYEDDVFYDTPHAYKKVINWIEQGNEVIFRCGFAYDERHGDEIIPAVKERMFAWNGERFELEEEKILRG